MANKISYRDRKVMTMGIVTEMTGLSERQVRYYETRKLIFPERTSTGIRKYSFSDIELLMDIAERREEGIQTHEIRKELAKRDISSEESRQKKKIIQGQLNAYFHQF